MPRDEVQCPHTSDFERVLVQPAPVVNRSNLELWTFGFTKAQSWSRFPVSGKLPPEVRLNQRSAVLCCSHILIWVHVQAQTKDLMFLFSIDLRYKSSQQSLSKMLVFPWIQYDPIILSKDSATTIALRGRNSEKKEKHHGSTSAAQAQHKHLSSQNSILMVPITESSWINAI